MQIVGDELSRLALDRQGNLQHFDLLGRSAFNRYYYSAFLITRETLGLMQSNWKGTAHAEIPNLLQTGLRKPVRHQLKQQVKKGLIDEGDSSRILTNIYTTGCELAQLLTSAYDARVLADYEPEIKITFEDSVIKLNSYKITTAREWPTRAQILCKQLLKLWKEIGLA
ncbi:hypothetical protein [Acinetobacter variabilis]|uniref:hypothetical protein n=1 Tax=Acinetobacter variabilis TaxID=70346 RepID=UPI002673D162|nr:hypothetical protein [Acinetobacter variabilis]WKT72201.1 hypothetical protein Q3F87_10085 [Acinetobacter variabilis]